MRKEPTFLDWPLLVMNETSHLQKVVPAFFSALAEQYAKWFHLGTHATLDETVEKAMDEHKTDKVNLVGHSLGGLESVAYALRNPHHINTCISVATPFHGTPVAYMGLAVLPLGIYTPVLQQILPNSRHIRGLQRHAKRLLPKSDVKFINIYSTIDEALPGDLGSLENITGPTPNLKEYVRPYGHAHIFYCELTLTFVQELIVESPYPTVMAHGILLNERFFDAVINNVEPDYKHKVFAFSYDYTKPLRLDIEDRHDFDRPWRLFEF